MSLLVFSLHWNLKEADSNASEGMDLPGSESKQANNKSFLLLATEDAAQIRGSVLLFGRVDLDDPSVFKRSLMVSEHIWTVKKDRIDTVVQLIAQQLLALVSRAFFISTQFTPSSPPYKESPPGSVDQPRPGQENAISPETRHPGDLTESLLQF
ncbi:hypothetical protein STEG23_007789 [Scotinomys teguina]